MKIKEVLIMCMVLVLLALCFCGCKAKNADFRVELVKSPPNWVALYGDNFESQQTANIALVIQTINKQAVAIKAIDGRLTALEDPNTLESRLDFIELKNWRKKVIDNAILEDPNKLEGN